MATPAVHVLVFNGYADWEPAHALAELRRSGNRSVITVGFDSSPVTSMGGLRVLPDKKLHDVRAADVEILIIPGSDLWEGSYPQEQVDEVLTGLVAAKVPVAGICGATLALARAGLLNDRRHTSNMPGYIVEHVPSYYGTAFYEDLPAVTDKGVITASGLAPIEFAREIFTQLRVFSPADDVIWFDMFKHQRLPESAN